MLDKVGGAAVTEKQKVMVDCQHIIAHSNRTT